MSQRDLEDRSGIPKSRISRYENGHLLPSLTGLRKLASSLGIAQGDLLGGHESVDAAFLAELRKRGVVVGSVREARELADILAAHLAKRTRGERASRGASR